MRTFCLTLLLATVLATAPVFALYKIEGKCPPGLYSFADAKEYLNTNIRNEDTILATYTDKMDIDFIVGEIKDIIESIDETVLMVDRVLLVHNGINKNEAFTFFIDDKVCAVYQLPNDTMEDLLKKIKVFQKGI